MGFRDILSNFFRLFVRIHWYNCHDLIFPRLIDLRLTLSKIEWQLGFIISRKVQSFKKILELLDIPDVEAETHRGVYLIGIYWQIILAEECLKMHLELLSRGSFVNNVGIQVNEVAIRLTNKIVCLFRSASDNSIEVFIHHDMLYWVAALLIHGVQTEHCQNNNQHRICGFSNFFGRIVENKSTLLHIKTEIFCSS